MRIVIDMQGAQTESRFHGIGRYTLSLVQAIVRHRGNHEVLLALSGLLPDTVQSIRATFSSLLPQANILVWQALGSVKESGDDNRSRREVSELVREGFLASLRPDVIFIPSLFEGFVDDAITSIGRFDTSTPVCVTIHDLIPLLNPEQYLKPAPTYNDYYRRKILSLEKASCLLTLSESSRQELLACLARLPDQVIHISVGLDKQFCPIEVPLHQAQALKAKLGLVKPFVLCVSGVDAQETLPPLLKAYAELPKPLKESHQLIIVGKIGGFELVRLRAELKSVGMTSDEDVLFAGYIPDEELIQLYNLCTVFVSLTWHGGGGLSALEAMACGAAVIGANNSSLSGIIALPDALFDPTDAAATTQCITRVLGDEAFRSELKGHGLRQITQFTWDDSAHRALRAFENTLAWHEANAETSPSPERRQRLAFVSPLPPERTGIAAYSAELLPALAEYYTIYVIVDQPTVSDPWIQAHCQVRDAQWLLENRCDIDRVIYQIGNSPFHRYMLDLLESIPGTVVLHDFYLSGLMSYLELLGGEHAAWVASLYESHGYDAVRARFATKNLDEVKRSYPVNLKVLQRAQGVIVHSEHSRHLAREFYSVDFPQDWAVIPHLRAEAASMDRTLVRSVLGLEQDDFLVCSFGYLGPTKLNHRLIEAWLESDLAKSPQCKLVFVGENHGGDYGARLLSAIKDRRLGGRVVITGWADELLYQRYLAAADMAVQLRTDSRGESSGTVLDCMNQGLPTVVNANGSMAELPEEAVLMLPDNFGASELVEALITLWRSPDRRAEIGLKAREVIVVQHSAAGCARRYAEAIEKFHDQSRLDLPALIDAIAATPNWLPAQDEYVSLAQALAANAPLKQTRRQLLLDISALCRTDLKTGIERTAKALTLALLNAQPEGFRVEPVYLDYAPQYGWLYRYARRYALGLLGCPQDVLTDEPVQPANGDLLIGLDISGDHLVEAEQAGLFAEYRDRGVQVFFMVHDLLPVQMPEVFPPGADAAHTRWLRAITKFDGAVCVTRAIADELAEWIDTEAQDRIGAFRIAWSHHGADFVNAAKFVGVSKNLKSTLREIKSRPSFLMVGTIEPRKGYLQAVEAFSQLWMEGENINLVIVGREGWTDLPNIARRDIPKTIRRLRDHPKLGQRLFWLDGINDEYLEKVYAASSCLIAASSGEGFGLPLIEAAQHRLPIIARDIPVFREVAGDSAYFFAGQTPADLARAVQHWLELWASGQHPDPSGLSWKTWAMSAATLVETVSRGPWYRTIVPRGLRQGAIDCANI